MRYPFIPYEVCGKQFEKPKHLFSKSFYFSLIFCASTYGTLVFPVLGEGWKEKSIFFFQLKPYYVPIHSVAAALITSLPFNVTCSELDTDSVVFGQGYVVLIMWGLFSLSATKYLKQHWIINAIIVLCGHANKSESWECERLVPYTAFVLFIPQ